MSTMLTATELAIRYHRRAVRFFWAWLLGATPSPRLKAGTTPTPV